MSSPVRSRRNVYAASHVLMIEPVHFRYNVETGQTNAFQSAPTETDEHRIADVAAAQHRQLRDLLVSSGVHVTVARSAEESPDAPFCNNWFSTHPAIHHDGAGGGHHTPATLVLYPLMAPNRRLERRPDLIALFRHAYPRVIDLTGYEREARFLESTGSLCLDDRARVAYAALSPRTDPALCQEWARQVGYRLITFSALDEQGVPYYHTNVMMFIGHGIAGVSLESIAAPAERAILRQALESSGLEIVPLTRAQAANFCGNCLSLTNDLREALLIMSSQAYRSFTPTQRTTIESHATILHTELSAFERVGGGSARCLIAELF